MPCEKIQYLSNIYARKTRKVSGSIRIIDTRKNLNNVVITRNQNIKHNLMQIHRI